MAELVDARDSKSRGGDTVSVRFRPSAPTFAKATAGRPRLFLMAGGPLFFYGQQANLLEKNMSECIFCKIINKQIPSKIIDENNHVIVIEDINPKTPIHYLVIPKIHVSNINDLQDTQEHNTAVREMFKMIKKLAANLPEPRAFNLVSNNGKQAGQLVFHMHWHFMSGKNIYSSGGCEL